MPIQEMKRHEIIAHLRGYLSFDAIHHWALRQETETLRAYLRSCRNSGKGQLVIAA